VSADNAPAEPAFNMLRQRYDEDGFILVIAL
jgi:hypothetical protein